MRDLFQVADACEGIGPLVRIVKKGIMPIIQIAIPIALILWGTFDLGKAVISSDDSEIKKAQKLLIKRFIYAAAVFFIVFFVGLIMDVVATSGESGTDSWSDCWKSIK